MKGFVVRTLLLMEALGAIPMFLLLLLVSPERYADSLAASGESIRARIRKYRNA